MLSIYCHPLPPLSPPESLPSSTLAASAWVYRSIPLSLKMRINISCAFAGWEGRTVVPLVRRETWMAGGREGDMGRWERDRGKRENKSKGREGKGYRCLDESIGPNRLLPCVPLNASSSLHHCPKNTLVLSSPLPPSLPRFLAPLPPSRLTFTLSPPPSISCPKRNCIAKASSTPAAPPPTTNKRSGGPDFDKSEGKMGGSSIRVR